MHQGRRALVQTVTVWAGPRDCADLRGKRKYFGHVVRWLDPLPWRDEREGPPNVTCRVVLERAMVRPISKSLQTQLRG